jgi:hypothetical protein
VRAYHFAGSITVRLSRSPADHPVSAAVVPFCRHAVNRRTTSALGDRFRAASARRH